MRSRENAGSGIEGLTSDQARKLLAEHGYNEIKAKRKNPYVLFLRKFYGPVQLLLWIVAVISYATGKYADLYIIIALLLFNAVIGFVEEYRADRSVEALKSMLASQARVLRDRQWMSIQARLLVTGDVIRVRLGDIIPADAKVAEADALELDESVISGESFLAEKKEGSMAYQGSVVKRGEATCIVTGTGADTRYGVTERLVQTASPKSHLEEAIFRLVKYLVGADAVIVAVMFLYGTIALRLGALILIPFLLVIIIASVPVALSAAFTIAMALGTEKLARKSVLVTRLEAMEDIATMDILCTDKTGTLTQNSITVKEIIPYGCDEQTVLKYATEASRRDDNDPIDNAILDYSAAVHIKAGRQISFMPFMPSTKRTQARIGGKGRYDVTKGATRVVVDLAHPSMKERRMIDADINRLAGKGFRAIAVASRRGKEWKLAGLVAMYDPPRPEVKHLVNELMQLGISTKMLTGDSLPVAKEIAAEVGLGSEIVVLGKNEAQASRIVRADGFASVYPQDKYTIVKALQHGGHVVGMTGDGVNDAPALKEAEAGIAVANATDVAKSAAAIVLTKNGLEVIIDAVKESRRIFERMATYAMVKVAKVFQIVGFVAITFIAFGFIPITPFLLILLTFTNDMVNIAISTDNAYYSGKPDKWNIKSIMYSSGVIGALLIVQAFVFIPLGFGVFGLSMAQFQTMVFLMFNVTCEMTVLNLREKRPMWKSRPSTPLVIALFIGTGVGIVFSYFGIFIASIGILPILAVLAIGAVFTVINDFVKVAAFRRFGISA